MEQFAKQIVATLVKLNGAAIGSIDTETAVTLTGGKKNPMQGRVTKLAEKCNVMFFCNSKSNGYNNMVQRRLAAEGKAPESFVLGKRPWGERVIDTPFITHKGNLYLEAIFLKSPKRVTYFLDGEEIDKNAIEGLKDSESSGGQGGLDNKVIIRTFKLKSIQKVKMGEFSVMPS